MMTSMSISGSALTAYGVRQQVSANNVANLNTDEFKAGRVSFEERPEHQGVRVQEIRQDESDGPLRPATEADSSPIGAAGAKQDGETGIRAESGMREGSNTDLAREMVTQMENEQGYAANAAVVRTQSRMVGEFLNRQV